jgi:hypothetical protein
MAFGDLTTLADVKAWLSTGQQGFPPTDDGLLTGLISAASQWIQTWLNRQVVSQDWIEIRDGTGGQRMVFGAYPVTAVLSVVVDTLTISPVPAGSQQGFASGYLFSPTVLALRGHCFSRRLQNVALTYTAGYSTVPPDIAQACIELVALRYRERTRIGEMSKHLGDGSTVSFSQRDMPPDVRTVLQQYRLVAPVTGFLTPAATQTDPATLVAAA